jgi:hypothetical protein
MKAHSHKHFKNKQSFIIVMMAITNLITHSIAILNFVPENNLKSTLLSRPIIAYSAFTCKISSYIFHVTTSLISWLMVVINFIAYYNIKRSKKESMS